MAKLTFDELYADLVAAAQTKVAPPEGTFTVEQFASDAGKSPSWAAARLLELVGTGVLEREKYGYKFYYWFKGSNEKQTAD